MKEANIVLEDIKNGIVKPIYCLYGEEPFYIDKISNYIEQNLLDEAEKGFNQVVLYGRDVTVDDIVSNAKRYPMMAERQVVIVKEAQDLSRTIEQLAPYAENPQPTTVLVLCYKYKKLDGRKALGKAIRKNGVMFESKTLYENQVVPWISNTIKEAGYKANYKAIQMLSEFLGTDLSKINNELKKLFLVIPKDQEITPELIEENIGISKDFNNFELAKAVGFKDVVGAQRIAQYFVQNPKANPLVLTISSLHGYFVKLLKYHGLPQKDKATVAKTLGIHPFFVEEYVTAARNYPMKRVSAAIANLRELDVKSKGVGASAFTSSDLLKETLVKIMQ